MRTVVLCAVGLGLMVFAARHNDTPADDFRQFYRAAMLSVRHQSVYRNPSFSPVTNQNADPLPYFRLPSYALALRPLSALPYRMARAVWIACIVFGFAAALRVFHLLWPANARAFAISLAFSFPVLLSLVLGQDTSLLLLIALAAAFACSRGREFLAGLIASLLALKLSCVPATGIVFLARSRRGTLGMATGLVVQFAVSVASEGIAWPGGYLSMLRGSAMTFEPRRMPNIRAIAVAFGLPNPFWQAAALILLASLFFASKRLRLSDALILAVPVGMIASPYCFVYDAVLLIPLLVLLPDLKWAAVALTPVPYLLLMADNPQWTALGSALVVAATLFAAIGFYRARASFRIDFASPFTSLADFFRLRATR